MTPATQFGMDLYKFFEHVYVDAILTLLDTILEGCNRLKLPTTMICPFSNDSAEVLFWN